MVEQQEEPALPIARIVLRRTEAIPAEFGANPAELWGEAVLLATQVEDGGVVLRPSIHFFGPGVESARGWTERLDLQAAGEPLWWSGDSTQDLDIQLTGQLLADGFMRDPENPTRFRLQRDEEGCCYGPTEDAIIRLEGSLRGVYSFNMPLDVMVTEEGLQAQEVGWLQCHINLNVSSQNPPWQSIDFDLIGSIGLDQMLLRPESPADLPLPAPAAAFFTAAAAPAAAAAAQQALCNPRTLFIQRVFFADAGTQTGGDSQRQLDSANDIWGKACITLAEFAQPQTRTNTELAQSNAMETICAAFDPPKGVIPIFFVANNLMSDGGGATMAAGTALARVVISDNSVRTIGGGRTINLSLLAHESGHVLGAVHPSETPPEGRWKGAANSIMAATSNVRNPLQNCLSAYNAVAAPVNTPAIPTCPMSPDPV
jgi:hypothetical protein